MAGAQALELEDRTHQRDGPRICLLDRSRIRRDDGDARVARGPLRFVPRSPAFHARSIRRPRAPRRVGRDGRRPGCRSIAIACGRVPVHWIAGTSELFVGVLTSPTFSAISGLARTTFPPNRPALARSPSRVRITPRREGRTARGGPRPVRPRLDHDNKALRQQNLENLQAAAAKLESGKMFEAPSRASAPRTDRHVSGKNRGDEDGEGDAICRRKSNLSRLMIRI